MDEMRILVIDEVHVKSAIGEFEASCPSLPINLFEEWDLGQRADQDPKELVARAKEINPMIMVIGGSHVLGDFKIATEVFMSAPALGYVIRAGVGTDHVNKQAATEARVRVINEPFGNNESTAEWALRLVLAALRGDRKGNHQEIILPREIFSVPVDEFRESHDFRLRTKNQDRQVKEKLARDVEHILSPNTMSQIEQLNDKRIGILGFGHIGSTVARKLWQLKEAYKLNLKILVYNHVDSHDLQAAKKRAEAEKLFDFQFLESAEQLFQQAEIITVHISGIRENEGFIDIRLLDGSIIEILVNTSRDFVVDHEDMLTFFDRNSKFKYFTDFAVGPYFKLPLLDRVVASNHIAGITRSANLAVWKNVGKIIVSIMKEFAGENMPNNYPYNIVNSPLHGGWREKYIAN